MKKKNHCTHKMSLRKSWNWSVQFIFAIAYFHELFLRFLQLRYFANDSFILTRNIWTQNLGQLLTFLLRFAQNRTKIENARMHKKMTNKTSLNQSYAREASLTVVFRLVRQHLREKSKTTGIRILRLFGVQQVQEKFESLPCPFLWPAQSVPS